MEGAHAGLGGSSDSDISVGWQSCERFLDSQSSSEVGVHARLAVGSLLREHVCSRSGGRRSRSKGRNSRGTGGRCKSEVSVHLGTAPGACGGQSCVSRVWPTRGTVVRLTPIFERTGSSRQSPQQRKAAQNGLGNRASQYGVAGIPYMTLLTAALHTSRNRAQRG